jgi:hypothetical protein
MMQDLVFNVHPTNMLTLLASVDAKYALMDMLLMQANLIVCLAQQEPTLQEDLLVLHAPQEVILPRMEVLHVCHVDVVANPILLQLDVWLVLTDFSLLTMGLVIRVLQTNTLELELVVVQDAVQVMNLMLNKTVVILVDQEPTLQEVAFV